MAEIFHEPAIYFQEIKSSENMPEIEIISQGVGKGQRSCPICFTFLYNNIYFIYIAQLPERPCLSSSTINLIL